MIKKVILENFQAHEYSEINLSEGVNVICGASDQGKSSVIRAIRWVLENRPSGFAFKRDGAEGPTRVTLVFDDCKIVKERSETENKYTVHEIGKKPIEYKALRTDVPEEIRDLTRFGYYNIQYQFGSSFLLDDSAGEVAKKLNNLSGVAIIDDILKETNSRIRTEKAKETATKELLDDLKKKQESFRHLKRLEKFVKEMGVLVKDIEDYKHSREILNNHIINLQRLESTVIVDTAALSKYVVALKGIVKDYSDYVEAKTGLKGNLESLARIETRLAKYKNFDEASTFISKARKALPQLEQLKSRRAALKGSLDKMRQCKLGLKSAITRIDDAKAALSEFKKEYKVCPVCNKKW